MCVGSFTLVVAGLPVRLEFENSDLVKDLSGQYVDFLGEMPADFVARIDWRATNRAAFCGYPTVVFTEDAVTLRGPGYEGAANLNDGRASLKISMMQPERGVDYFLRLIYALLAFRAGGIMLHGAAVARKNFAYIFFGKSGSGKTTVSRLTADGIVLNDDLIVLMPGDEHWVAHATPFTNINQVAPHAASAPVAGIYRLVKDQAVYLEKMSLAMAVSELLASVPVMASEPRYARVLVKRCEKLADIYPVSHLHFRKDTDFWRLIEK